MKKFLSIISKIALFIWQMPQEFVGFYMLVFYYGRRRIDSAETYKANYVFYIYKLKGGVSLSRFIFVNSSLKGGALDFVRHEYGHSRQSMMLGPLYLLVVGLPSVVWGLLYRPSWKKSYYWFWTEKWANKLGKVVLK